MKKTITLKSNKKRLGMVALLLAFCTMQMQAIIRVGGTNTNDVSFGTGWSWDSGTKTLSLTDTYTGELINSDETDPITIEYTGNVAISTGDFQPISAQGSLTIRGSASDKLSLTGSQIIYSAGELTIEGGEIIGTSLSAGNSAVLASGVTINNAKVTITPTESSCKGIYSTGDINISGSSDLDITGTGFQYALYSAGLIAISDGTVNLNQTNNYYYTGDLTMTTGSILTFNHGTPPSLTSISPNSGPVTGGTVATLTGTSFTGVDFVSIGNGYPLFLYTPIDDTEIEVTMPINAAPGAVDVYVRTPGGMCVLQNAFTYQIPPGTTIDIPAIQGVTVPVAGGTPVSTITETDQYTGTVEWFPADAVFQEGVLYMATIILTPKAGYTLYGVPLNYFTVAGAPFFTNYLYSGVIVAVFPIIPVTPPLPPTGPLEIVTQPISSSICVGSSYTFKLEAKGDGLTYQWYKGNAPLKGATSNELSITNATSADYELYYVIVRGTDGQSLTSNKVRLWVADYLPTNPMLTEYPNPAITGNTYHLKVDGYTDVTKYTWSYSKEGVTFSPEVGLEAKNETWATFGTLSAGTGTLKVTMEHPCGTRELIQAITVKYPTGVEDVTAEVVQVYPNPTSGVLKVLGTESNQQIRVTDVTGSLKGTYKSQEGITTIDLTGYAKGTYMVQYNGKTYKVIKK